MTFDSLSFARRLRSSFSAEQAEALADALREAIADEMVTRAYLTAELDRLALRLTMRAVSIAVLALGALTALIKLP